MIALRKQPPVYRGKKYMKNKIFPPHHAVVILSAPIDGVLVSWGSTAYCQSHDVGGPSVSVAFIG